MRKRLLEGEQVLIACRPHSRILLWPLCVGFVLLVASAAALGRLQPAQYLSWAPSLPALREPAIVVLIAAFVVIEICYPLRRVLSWAATRYILTSHRIVVRSGSLGRRNTDYYFIDTLSLHMRQKLRQRMVGSGNLEVESASGAVHTVREIPFMGEFFAEAHSAWQSTLRGNPQQSPGFEYYSSRADFVPNDPLDPVNEKELRKLGRAN